MSENGTGRPLISVLKSRPEDEDPQKPRQRKEEKVRFNDEVSYAPSVGGSAENTRSFFSIRENSSEPFQSKLRRDSFGNVNEQMQLENKRRWCCRCGCLCLK
ncbi:uncharacterized protein LOC101860028 [Aplysia californica]|uniref:Uncharacterized protein LOC101860028 n=1 Tax=Aplysia californica TaxID=6500 RepID=A0ABM0JV51_APLCA|nr:uncharacterized protein LOC101860028 [Aplysia californica]